MKIIFLALWCLSWRVFSDDSIFVYGKRVLPSLASSFELTEQDPFYLEEFERYLPNVTSLKGGQKSRFIQVRGVGERSDYAPLTYRSVGVFIDGIDYSDFPQAVHRFGLERSQLILGPNPNGRLGGVINHIEKVNKHQSQWLFHAGASDEKSGTLGLQYLSSNLDNVNVRATLVRHKGEGFYYNETVHDKTNDRDEVSTKWSFAFQGFEQKFHYHLLDNGYDAFNVNNSFVSLSDKPGTDRQEIVVSESSYSYQLGSLFAKSSVEYFKANSLYAYDEDWNADPAYDYNIFFRKNRERLTLSQDFETDRVSALLRYIDLNEEQVEHGFNSGVTRSLIRGDIRRRLMWSQLSFDYGLGDGMLLRFESSLEYNRLTYRNDQGFNRSLEEWPYFMAIGLSYQRYALTLKHASKGGGFSTQSQIPDERKTYGKEKMSTLDLSLESDRGGRKVHYKFNAFLQHREDVQVSTSFQDDPSDPSSFTFYIDNATSAWGYGMEGHASYDVNRWFKVMMNLSLMRARFNHYQVGSRQLRGRELPYTPNYQVQLRHQIRVAKDWLVDVDYYQQDDYYFSNSHDQKGQGYGQWDVRLRYEKKALSLSLYVRNFFDEDIETRGFFFGNRPPNFEAELFTQRGLARVAGFSLDLMY